MITKIYLKRFKKFSDEEIELKDRGLTILAGPNNSGKSSVLQALAVWDFCRTVLLNEKGPTALLPTYRGQGLGLSDDEFAPVLLASLPHLWTNLKYQVPGSGGYSLAVGVEWEDVFGPKKLVISLALANDRIFIKTAESTLLAEDYVPSIAYVPPFAGISAKEMRMGQAQRRALQGSGLVGGTIRNLLLDLKLENQRRRTESRGTRSKLSDKSLREIRDSDPWELLQSAIGRHFQTGIDVEPFNDLYHSYIRAKVFKGEWQNYKINRFPGFTPRDLMAEGSGFLQWLSVFSLALDPKTNVVLLDEPDAHLHSSLQISLIKELDEILKSQRKQILFATHSTEILRWIDHDSILRVEKDSIKYLVSNDQKIGLFSGLGSEFSPKIDQLKKTKCMLIVEGQSDESLLKELCFRSGRDWPKNLVIWPWTGSSKERRQLYNQLKGEISDLRCISIRDRDDQPPGSIDKDTLFIKGNENSDGNLKLCVWNRRHIENYLFCPEAIARAANCNVEEVQNVFQRHGIHIPPDHTSTSVPTGINDARGKDIFENGEDSIRRLLNVNKFEVAQNMLKAEIAEDLNVFFDHLISHTTP